MDSLDATSHPFVIRIWLEQSAGEGHPAVWRGHITHVPSGARRYFQHLDDIASFVAPYLESMGIKLGPWRRAGRWMKHLGQSQSILLCVSRVFPRTPASPPGGAENP